MQNLNNIIKLTIVLVLLLLVIWTSKNLTTKEEKKPDESTLFVKVDWGDLPENHTIVGNTVNTLKVKVIGSKEIIDDLQNKELVYKPDLSGISSGTALFEIDPDNIVLPAQLTIIGVEPSSLTFKVENHIEKILPIKLNLSGIPSDNYSLSEIYLKPSKIKIKAPQYILKDMDCIYTKNIDLNGISEPINKEIPLNISDKLLPYVPNRIVRIEISLVEKIAKKIIKKVRVKTKNTVYKSKIMPSSVDLIVEGSIIAVRDLDTKKDVNVYVDLKNLKPGLYARRVKIELPGNVSLIGVKPEVFTVKIYKFRR